MADKPKDKTAKVSRDQLLKPRATKTTTRQTTALDRSKLTRIRVVPVPLSQIVLDRYQPRPILPVQERLRDDFFGGKTDWRKTADTWLALAKSDASIKSQTSELLEMGKSINELSQIEPASGAWVEVRPGDIKMLLSTGERRFWSLALLAASNKEGEPQLEVQEIDVDELNLARQIVENESAKPLSAIGKARAIAGLILERIEELPPELNKESKSPPTDHEYYSAVLDLEELTGSKYMPRGMWEEIGEIMGMDRPYMTYHIDLLQLPEEVQYLADSNEVPERVLREILKLTPAQWEKAVRKAITDDLTHADIRKIRGGGPPKAKKPVTRAIKAGRRMKAFWKESKAINSDTEIGKAATEFAVGQEKVELEKAITKLEKFVGHLRLRVEGMD